MPSIYVIVPDDSSNNSQQIIQEKGFSLTSNQNVGSLEEAKKKAQIYRPGFFSIAEFDSENKLLLNTYISQLDDTYKIEKNPLPENIIGEGDTPITVYGTRLVYAPLFYTGTTEEILRKELRRYSAVCPSFELADSYKNNFARRTDAGGFEENDMINVIVEMEIPKKYFDPQKSYFKQEIPFDELMKSDLLKIKSLSLCDYPHLAPSIKRELKHVMDAKGPYGEDYFYTTMSDPKWNNNQQKIIERNAIIKEGLIQILTIIKKSDNEIKELFGSVTTSIEKLRKAFGEVNITESTSQSEISNYARGVLSCLSSDSIFTVPKFLASFGGRSTDSDAFYKQIKLLLSPNTQEEDRKIALSNLERIAINAPEDKSSKSPGRGGISDIDIKF